MRIAIDCRFWGSKNTGLGRYTQNLVENLTKIDKKNYYFLLFRKEEIKKGRLSFDNKKKISLIPIDIPHYSLKEQLFLPFILRKIKPDLVHFPHFNAPIFGSGKYIVTIHDLIKHYSRGGKTTTRAPWIYLIKYLGYKKVFYYAVKQAKKIITPSYWVKKILLKKYPFVGDKIEVVYEGVARVFSQKKKLSLEVLDNYKIKRPFIIYTGNVYPHKNLRRLLLAVKMINSAGMNLKLVIVSPRDIFWKRLKKEIADFKADSFTILPGFIPDQDLSEIYQQAEAFVMPSLMEGFGLPGLEAMAVGCPIVCSNIPVFKEIYDGAVEFFNPEEVEEIKEKIIKVINLSAEERKRRLIKGKKQAQKYSWLKGAKQTLKIYENCFNL